MRDFVYIGSTPCDEPCQQVGMLEFSADVARRECLAFINQLRRQFGQEPEGMSLRVKMERHDFGSYPEVVCCYNDESQTSVDYAYRCEGESPANWDMQAIIELQPSSELMAGYRL